MGKIVLKPGLFSFYKATDQEVGKTLNIKLDECCLEESVEHWFTFFCYQLIQKNVADFT